MNPFKVFPHPVRECLADNLVIAANIVNVPLFCANALDVMEAILGIIIGPVEDMRDPFDPRQSLLMRDALDDENPSFLKDLHDFCAHFAIPFGMITAPITTPLVLLESIIRP